MLQMFHYDLNKIIGKENSQGHIPKGSRESDNRKSWGPDLGRHLLRGFRSAEFGASPLAKRCSWSHQLRQRGAHFADPAHAADDASHHSEQSAPNRNVCPLSHRGESRKFSRKDAHGDVWDKKEAAEQGCTRPAECGGGTWPMSCRLLGPGWSKDKGAAPWHTYPQGSEEERGHNSNPK